MQICWVFFCVEKFPELTLPGLNSDCYSCNALNLGRANVLVLMSAHFRGIHVEVLFA